MWHFFVFNFCDPISFKKLSKPLFQRLCLNLFRHSTQRLTDSALHSSDLLNHLSNQLSNDTPLVHSDKLTKYKCRPALIQSNFWSIQSLHRVICGLHRVYTEQSRVHTESTQSNLRKPTQSLHRLIQSLHIVYTE